MGYDPLEVNPEDMVRFAKEKPQVKMAGNGASTIVEMEMMHLMIHDI